MDGTVRAPGRRTAGGGHRDGSAQPHRRDPGRIRRVAARAPLRDRRDARVGGDRRHREPSRRCRPPRGQPIDPPAPAAQHGAHLAARHPRRPGRDCCRWPRPRRTGRRPLWRQRGCHHRLGRRHGRVLYRDRGERVGPGPEIDHLSAVHGSQPGRQRGAVGGDRWSLPVPHLRLLQRNPGHRTGRRGHRHGAAGCDGGRRRRGAAPHRGRDLRRRGRRVPSTAIGMDWWWAKEQASSSSRNGVERPPAVRRPAARIAGIPVAPVRRHPPPSTQPPC